MERDIEMKMAKFARIILVVMITTMTVISLTFSLGLSKMSGRQQTDDMATSENPPLAKNESEKRTLSVLDKMYEGPVVDELHGRLLRILVESTKARNVVEIGTGSGYSAIWLCLGLKSTGGKLVTHEIDYEKVLLAKANFKRAGVENLVTVVVGDAHRTIAQLKEPIDILFLDAEGGNLDYLNKLLPLVRPGGLILVDNISKPGICHPCFKVITNNPNLETVLLNMQGTGISLTVKKH
jgi:caffeoyl-CoA O-methyltransferase